MSNKPNIHDLKQEQSDRMDKILKDHRVFFAFSNEQFAENKTELKEGEKYVSIGAGGYAPKTEVDGLLADMEALRKWFNSETKKIRTEHIAYELANHECYYTGNIDDACAVLPYSRKTVQKVYNEKRAAWAADN